MTDDKVKVAVIGGGAIGGFLASALQAAGHDVTLCVRTPFAALRIETAGVAREVPVRIASDPDDLHEAPWVLLAVKAQDTRSAAPWLARLAGAGTTVVALQNGIEHEQRLRPVAGDAAVLPGLVYAAVERVRPGHIVHYGGSRIVVPQGNRGAAFARLLAGSELNVVEEPDFTTAVWRKLLSNVASNPITALTMRRVGVMRDPRIRDLARALLLEAVATGRAAGAQLTDADTEDILTLYESFGDSAGSSMLYDRLAGRPLEHEYLTGAVVHAADRHGVPVPLNRAVLALLGALDDGLRA